MDILPWIHVIIPLFCLVLAIQWATKIGPLRAGLAGLGRYMWILPMILMVTPKDRKIDLPRSLITKKVHALVDDSTSMLSSQTSETEKKAILQRLKERCTEIGCLVKETLLSDLEPDAKKGYSPISEGLSKLHFSSGSDPWVLISDGGETKPQGIMPSAVPNGVVMAVGPEDGLNYSVKAVGSANLAFEGKATEIAVTIGRMGTDSSETVQIQASIDALPVTSINVKFDQGKEEAKAFLQIPTLKRGQYLLTIGVIGVASERILWDNTQNIPLEVLPNTVGILHVLGSPDWDGRFLRRYLKSEPKFDLISFYILRDIFDQNSVDQRELSLIPFPVERLFTEELASFRVLALQNFTLQKFLQPELSKNLISFIQNGGGALILGGPRAFKPADLSSSALSEILPFQYKGPKGTDDTFPGVEPLNESDSRNEGNSLMPWYDAGLKFRIQLSHPDPDQRALASVYDDLESMQNDLAAAGELQGLHHMENVEFKAGSYTPLLEAVRPDGKVVPLAIATYPGKGRAIWVFTDKLWELGLSGTEGSPSRDLYNRVIESLFTWLLREDIRKPLRIVDIGMTSEGQGTSFKIQLRGPALRYLTSLENWSVQVCDRAIPKENLDLTRAGTDELFLTGQIKAYTAVGLKCQVNLEAKHKAFGSLKMSQITAIPQVFTDKELPGSREYLKRLAAHMDAPFYSEISDLDKWLVAKVAGAGIIEAPKSKIVSDYFWCFDFWWFYILILGLPLEVAARRWDKIAGSKFSTIE